MKSEIIELKDKLKKLEEEFSQYKKEFVKWSVEDFIYKAREIGYSISKKKGTRSFRAHVL